MIPTTTSISTSVNAVDRTAMLDGVLISPGLVALNLMFLYRQDSPRYCYVAKIFHPCAQHPNNSALTPPPQSSIQSPASVMRPSKFKFERECFQRGCSRVAGADEAGRGPLAGPVVAAVVCLPPAWIVDGLPRKLQGLNDSKQLAEKDRERFFDFLTQSPLVSWAISTVDVQVIDSINILQASLRAMHQALLQLSPAPDHTLVDGPHIFSALHSQTALVDGDAKSFSIAAASVLAKVTRDRLMTELHEKYPQYGFRDHKGYSTPQHLRALAQFGPSPIHRRSFAPCRPASVEPQPQLFL
jgi:ribonuclease HII